MTGLVAWLDRRFYPEHGRNWDDQLFRTHILSRLKPSMTVLDVGAGAGIVGAMNFRGQVARICGVDLDPRVVDNPFLDEGRQADAGRIPYPDASFDVAFADNVMEHLDAPTEVLSEVFRVLKPGGILLFKTPNRTHYVPTIARMTPLRFHQFVNKQRGRAESDTFPTVYLGNTARDVRRLAKETGFDVVKIDRIEGRPEYLRVTAVTYVLGAIYERIVNSTDLLSCFRILLVAELQRPA
ncbi:MAG: class I SAM-dependent methyltransferase [Erythrobacter sp.]|nr:class I SAM-dependent methyltransferase [Erythrobacter sp.]